MRSLLLTTLLATAALADPPPAAAPSPAPAAATDPTAVTPPAPGINLLNGRFEFGSYGRVGVGSDLRGRLGSSANIVSFGPRLVEDSYAELELRRDDQLGPVKSHVVSTVAFFPPFFHFTGSADQRVGLRNLYAEASVGEVFSAWAGSRMYRGDDIYLLNFWPLDNQNTVGGGVRLKFNTTQVLFHMGMQRLDQPAQHEYVVDNDPLGYGTVPVARLDRPRMVESLKLVHELPLDGFGLRFTLYAEAHELPGGVTRDTNTGDETALPGDWGVLAGGQVSAWLPNKAFAHVWLRQAVGLATYDDLTTPATTANDRTTQGAHSTRLAFAAGWDGAMFGVLAGGYLDLVRDAGPAAVSSQKYDEGAIAVRGQWNAFKYFGVAVEASHQRRTYALLDAAGNLRSGSVTQFGLMPYFSPLGPGLFSRPQIRLIYALSLRDAGARSFYAADDVASQRPVEHYVGLSVEWWFNSTTYPR